MDINQSTVQGNADAITNLCKQAAIGDHSVDRGVENIGDHVVLVHGDLSTCERVQSLQVSRGVEKTPWLRFVFVIFVIGLFHLKMACADAIWKIFIQLKQGRADDTGLFKLVAEIRPKETGKFGSKPSFRYMHEVIRHVGIVSRLDCWREMVCKLERLFPNLESWAAAKPSWDEVEGITRKLVRTYLPGMAYSTLHFRPPEIRDEVQENVLLQDQYFMYYEELSYAMDTGDIGRVETCFMPWVFIFKGCGKHKYATQMIWFLHDLYFVYPERLRHAIRMNILCNPSGKPFHFRAIDWWVEHNNLYTKRIHGGRFSNRTKARILKESALIEVYKTIRMTFEKMFALNHRTYRHSQPKMDKTFKKLATYMAKIGLHKQQPRTSKYNIKDAKAEGMHKLVAAMKNRTVGLEDIAEIGDGDVEAEADGEDGDLDV
ncbi:hypothetical protein DAEQUDRAFT_719004 [Daedalea quercina L-15889]|uniref:DUF6589 domain-containing protein n=1 Tax=Daedalea quercina L-15889 TaxID=1314783 RepID=A0A165KZR5_9APHY|nr:hypothetical protein DAEQUDRAFT_719004 [Daedalea quercina L-15889]